MVVKTINAIESQKDKVNLFSNVYSDTPVFAVISKDTLTNSKNAHLFKPKNEKELIYKGVMGKYSFTDYEHLNTKFKSEIYKSVKNEGYEVINTK